MKNFAAPVSFRIADLALLRGADFLSVFDPSQRQALAIFPLAPMKKEDAPTLTRLASTLDVLGARTKPEVTARAQPRWNRFMRF